MGGKSKQSQRTKNNVRPSSSSRSAELLSSSAGLDGGLVTLGSGKPLPPLFPTLAAVNLEQGLNPEFQMCIKKLNKKDPITRTKALQELCELVNNGNIEDVVAALPSWAHFYKILTTDTDRKVREVTQMCHGAIVRVCGRRVAPQLKALLPAWLTAQYDEHAPAQAHAHLSLTSTFPDSKLPEVISFCKAEVMAHLIDNLIGNAEAVVSKRIESAEERELQMSRVLCCSLQGLAYLCAHLPRAHDAWLSAELQPLLAAHAFWKLAHGPSLVRAAWLGALGALAARGGAAWGAAHGARALRVLLDAARARDAAVAAPLWPALLQLMTSVPDWHTYLDKKELLVKRILDVLESGGWGDARQLSNMLLPLLAYLPKDILTKDFYEAFFKAMFTGLEKKNILNSKSERQAWITSLAECLRYLSIQQHDFVLEVVTGVHRTWLEKVLSTQHDGQTRNNLIKFSATNMTSLVKYWLKQSKEENSEKYDQLVRNFWQNVGSTVLAQIDKCGTDQTEIAKLMDGHILLLQTLKTTFAQEAKKQQRIKFDGDEPAAPEPRAAAAAPCDAAALLRYQHNLDDLVHNVCVQYFHFAEQKQVASAVLTQVITLLIEFDSESLFLALARHFDVDSVYRLYEKTLRTWLSGDTMRCKAVVDIVFLMMKYMDDDEKESTFDTFKQFPPAVLEWCMGVSAREPGVRCGVAVAWLRGALVARALRALAVRAACHADARAVSLLQLCLGDAPDGEPLVSLEGVSQVLSTLCEAICEPLTASRSLEASGALAARLVTTLHERSATPHYVDLVQGLFRLSILVPRGDSRISVDTWCEIRSSWQDGIAALPEEARKQFYSKTWEFLKQHLQEDMKAELLVTKIENIATTCPYLLSVGPRGRREDAAQIVQHSRELLALPHAADDCAAPALALRHLAVTAQLHCLCGTDNDLIRAVIQQAGDPHPPELTKQQLLCYLNKFLFRAIYLRTILLHNIDPDDDEDESTEPRTWCGLLLQHEYMLQEYYSLFYNYVILKTLHEAYAFWPHYHIIEEAKKKLDSLIPDVVAGTPDTIKQQIASSMLHQSVVHGYYWADAYRCYESVANVSASTPAPVLTTSSTPTPTPSLTSSTQPAEPDTKEDNIGEKNEDNTIEKEEKNEDGTTKTRDGVVGKEDNSSQLKDDDVIARVFGQNFVPEPDMSGHGFFHSLQAYARWHGSAAYASRVRLLLALRSWNAAYAAPRASAGLLLSLDVIIDAYYTDNDTMLYEKDVSGAEWGALLSNAAVAEYLTDMVTLHGWDAPPHHWDFATITLCSLLASLYKTRENWTANKVLMLTRAVLRLYAAVRGFVRQLRAACERRVPAPHVADLASEWTDIFAPDTSHNLLSLAVHVLETCNEYTPTSTMIAVVGELIKCVQIVEWDSLPATHKHGTLSLLRITATCNDVLSQPAHHAYKHLAYSLLLAVAKPLVLDDAEKLSLWSDESLSDGDEEKERPKFCLDYFHDAFTHLHEIDDAALTNIVLGEETCEMEAMSDGYSMVLGWLLLAEVLHELCSLARGDLTHHYIQIYRERKYAEPLVTAALRLLPADVFACASEHDAPAQAQHAPAFYQVLPFSVDRPAASADVGALACRTLYGALCGAGCSGVRGWWSAAAAQPARLLQRVVTLYVAPHAARQQLLTLQQRAHELHDAEVRIAWSSHEVTCVYNVEERVIELRVWLSRAHPLLAPRLAAPHAAGVGANTHWVALYLAYQNGTLLNALKMWTAAVSAKVESSPQCYICYCRLHPNTGRLPRVPCHQCKNKFHNICLRKWFQTSNKSNCPLCRSAF